MRRFGRFNWNATWHKLKSFSCCRSSETDLLTRSNHVYTSCLEAYTRLINYCRSIREPLVHCSFSSSATLFRSTTSTVRECVRYSGCWRVCCYSGCYFHASRSIYERCTESFGTAMTVLPPTHSVRHGLFEKYEFTKPVFALVWHDFCRKL